MKAIVTKLTKTLFVLSFLTCATTRMCAQTNVTTLNHPCMLHTSDDFTRIQNHLSMSPWQEAYAHLCASSRAQTGQADHTSALLDGYLKRMDYNNWGPNGSHGQYADYNNYTSAMYDAATCYQLALRYRISGDTSYADNAVAILNAWKNNCKGILRLDGYTDRIPDPNEYLMMIQGHQFANAAELLRDYSGWSAADFNGFKEWMRITYLDISKLFLTNHRGGNGTMHSWLNWDLSCMTSVLAVAILCDDTENINWVIDYFKGTASGSNQEVGYIRNAVPYVHDDPDSSEKLGQCEESGRDQGHATLCVSLMGAFCQMALNVGEDLFAYDDYRALSMAEYVGKHNLIKDTSWSNSSLSESDFYAPLSSIPYTHYTNPSWDNPTLSNDGRGTKRPAWEVFYNYAKAHGKSAIYSKKWAEQMRELTSIHSDGGGGDYGNNSGGYDQLGYGTLMYAVPDEGMNVSNINVDIHMRSDNPSNNYTSSGNTEIYNNVKSGSEREFVQLLNLTMPATPMGYRINSVELRLVSKRAKGPTDINIYNYGNTVTEAATWNSEASYISTARTASPITSFTVAGQYGKDITDNGITSAYQDISAWTNTIDLTDFALDKAGQDINLLLSAATTQETGDAVQFFTNQCNATYTNSNNGLTYYKADLVPLLMVTYTEQKEDIIDHATGAPVSAKNASSITISTTTEGKGIVKFTPTAAGEIGLTFNSEDYYVDNTQNFFVIETNSGAINGSANNFKCRSLNLDGTNYDANTGDMKAVFTVGDRQVLILSPLGQANSSTAYTPVFSKFYNTADGTPISVAQATTYFTVAGTSEVTIYRAALLNLGEILDLYPELAAKNWQFVASNALRLEASGNNSGANGSDGTIQIKNNDTSLSTYNVFRQQMRSLGTLPDNYTTANYRYFHLEEGTTATTEDLLTPVSGLQFIFTRDMVRYFPTLTPKKVQALDCYYWAYKDGVAPVKDDFYVYSKNTYRLVDYTRKFLRGYNSCILPFDLDLTELPEGWAAYTFRSFTNNQILFKLVRDKVNANTPFLIRVPDKDTEGLYVIPSTNTADPLASVESYYPTAVSNGARFVGSYINEIPDDTYGANKYGVDKSGNLKKMKETTKTTYYRAFVAVSEGQTAKSITFTDTDVTGIGNVNGNVNVNEGIVYDLQGRKVADNAQGSPSSTYSSPLKRGIYIKNGKKIIIR